MKRFWLALTVALFFYAKMDIIWQRIFETHELIDLGVGVYHWGWVQALFGFMILGVLLFYPRSTPDGHLSPVPGSPGFSDWKISCTTGWTVNLFRTSCPG